MKGVLRIALAFFSVLPLQRWLNLIGGALLVIGMGVALADGASTYSWEAAGLPLFLGTAFIVLTPGFLGGALMRLASNRTLLHLRPHGRLKLLLGATLAITMMAVLVALVMLLAKPWPVLEVFADAWSFAALVWIGAFIGSGSPIWILVIWIGAVGIGQLRDSIPVIPIPGALAPLLLALLAWVAFCAWYMTVRTVRHGGWLERSRSMARSDNGPAGRPTTSIFSRDRDAWSFSGTRLYLIGTSSLAGYALSGVLPLLGFMALRYIYMLGKASHGLPLIAPVVPPVALPMLTMLCATTGISIVGRARLLWLRAGVDRMALFALAEQQALRICMTTLGTGIAVYLLVSCATRPDYALTFCLFAGSQLAFGICMFYGGLSLTRGWALAETLPGLGLLLLIQVVATASATIAYPPRDLANAASCGALVLYLLLAPLLRWHARRRWRGLDWRVTRLSVSGVTATRDIGHLS